MASFQKYDTKDGPRWLYKYYSTINPETGKRKQSTKRGFRTKKEAQLDAAQTEKEIADGSFVAQDRTITFEKVYEQWYATHSPNFKPSTKKAVRSKFKQQLLPRFGNIKMVDITRSYCQEVINEMAKKITTIDNMKMYANQIFEYGIKMNIITRNPMKGAVIPKSDDEHLADSQKERNYWEKHEIKRFLGIVKEEFEFKDFLMFHLLIYTGARKGEVLALRWSDIDFKKKTVSLNKTLFHEKDKGFMALTSKTAASRRVLSLDDTTLGLLKKRRSEQNRGPVAPINPTDDRLIFTREDGTPIRLAYPNDKLNEIIENHKLHSITVHGLRHTHASLLFEAGASIKEVQERLGHSDIKMTMNIYTHVTNAAKEKTADRFEKFMESEPPVTGSDVVTNGQEK
ncbi:Site-specific recombinase XerD [Paenibacillus sophorae]|uniref:Site-specific integrase n=1 Tax=Paenibacillus sophorae TaxID=1333845 RepID=A0A1H8VTZ0_9BACL|nr:site-specific integrase [Paenibacillus sophorae]QWU15714.1 site-specific integrase [Paenibacillus sophorae]SEP18876.1 Site-specific recombinase XerD [Paenibacillus sophorae]